MVKEKMYIKIEESILEELRMVKEKMYIKVDMYMYMNSNLTDKYIEQNRKLSSRIRKQKTSIETFVESKLGHYSSTFEGSEYLFKVWEDDKWRCMVANGYGIEFSVDASCSSEEAVDLWEKFLEKLN